MQPQSQLSPSNPVRPRISKPYYISASKSCQEAMESDLDSAITSSNFSSLIGLQYLC